MNSLLKWMESFGIALILFIAGTAFCVALGGLAAIIYMAFPYSILAVVIIGILTYFVHTYKETP